MKKEDVSLEGIDSSGSSANAPDGLMEQLEKKKEELFAKLKGVSSRLRHKQYEAKVLKAALEEKMRETGLNVRELRRRKERLEFKIATEALTLAKEREMMKEMRMLEKELEKAGELERMERKLRLVEGDIRSAEAEIAQIKKDIDAAKAEIKAIREGEREKVKEQRAKEWEEKKRAQLMERRAKREEELKKELEPYLGGVDEEGVELGAIAVIKKKSSS